MSKDSSDIIKEVLKNNKDLYKVENNISKEIDSLNKDIQNIQKDIKHIKTKVDAILNLLDTLIVVISDESYDEDLEDDEDVSEYESNEGWLPEVSEWEKHYENDEDDEENI